MPKEYKYKGKPTIFIKPGSRVFNILKIIAVAGEVGTTTFKMFGDNKKEHIYNQTVRLILKEATYKSADGKILFEGIAFVRRGNGEEKTIRVNPGAEILVNYVKNKDDKPKREKLPRLKNDSAHIMRNVYMSDWCGAALEASIEFSLENIPELYDTSEKRTLEGYVVNESKKGMGADAKEPRKVTHTLFYVGKEIKRCDSVAKDSANGSRAIGCLVKPDELLVCYSLPNRVMKWLPKSESNFESYVRRTMGPYNFGITKSDLECVKAICMAKNYEEAEKTIFSFKCDEEDRKKYRETGTSFVSLFSEIYVIPKSPEGVKQLKLLSIPNLTERIIKRYMPEEDFKKNKVRSTFSCDGYDIENKEALFFFWNGNINKLRKNARIIESLRDVEDNAQISTLAVFCFPWQEEYIRKTLGNSKRYGVYPTDFETVYKELLNIRI